jgi:hypothetical protein
MKENSSGNNGDQIIVSGTNLAAKLAWLQSNAQSNSSYIVEVNADESIKPQQLSYEGKSNITITLKGINTKRTISLSSNGALFNVNSGVTLVLDDNITLHGRKNNNKPLVEVSGALIMNSGSAIINNKNCNNDVLSDDFSSSVGGVLIWGEGGIFTMNGGTISGNTGGEAGGVSMYGTFIMNDGTISNNTANSYGGMLVLGTFTMNGGIISGNTANGTAGGVGVNGTFDMKGGTISGNTAQANGASGGGVYVSHSSDKSMIGVFSKTGGTIIGYTSDAVNGNVVRDDSGTAKIGWGHAVAGVFEGAVVEFKDTTTGPADCMEYDAEFEIGNGAWDAAKTTGGGCYVATCVYGSYDCPEVWTLRRYRDSKLSVYWFGRRFIQIYYAISPKIVELFGNKKWFNKLWKPILNKIVRTLQNNGIESSSYLDK